MSGPNLAETKHIERNYENPGMKVHIMCTFHSYLKSPLDAHRRPDITLLKYRWGLCQAD
jgi:hypothetical protein